MRKSPIEHKVHSHKRVGIKVTAYTRGEGSNPVDMADPTLQTSNHPTSNFDVTIRYVSIPSETIQVKASTYPEAIQTAMTIRHSTVPPLEVEATKQ